jgi:hypothetical protein
MGEAAALEKDGVERDLQAELASHQPKPFAEGAGLRGEREPELTLFSLTR